MWPHVLTRDMDLRYEDLEIGTHFTTVEAERPLLRDIKIKTYDPANPRMDRSISICTGFVEYHHRYQAVYMVTLDKNLPITPQIA